MKKSPEYFSVGKKTIYLNHNIYMFTFIEKDKSDITDEIVELNFSRIIVASCHPYQYNMIVYFSLLIEV